MYACTTVLCGHVGTYVCTYVCMRVSMYVCIYVCMYVCMYAPMYAYVYIYICVCGGGVYICIETYKYIYICMCVCTLPPPHVPTFWVFDGGVAWTQDSIARATWGIGDIALTSHETVGLLDPWHHLA